MTGFAPVPVADDPEDGHDRRWAGVARVLGPAWAKLPSLTVGLFGVQTLWSVEMSYASPYLLSLGLSKSFMAIVFLAGPLSGLIVQPVIGILADNSKSRFGRRRPYIMASTALCAFATILLGFTRQFASIFTARDSPANDTLTIWLAIISIYCMDFSVNAVQALDRALLVDTVPTAKQPAGNAWAARMQTVGSVAGFFVGYLNLPQLFPIFGRMQLEALSIIAALLLFATQSWMCFHVKERILLSFSAPKGLGRELNELRKTLVRLPSVIRQICWIQFFASLGWFPLMFYTTIYIGDLYKKSSPIPENADAAIALDDQATRLGTRALFYSALVSLTANIILPWFVVRQRAGHASDPLQPIKQTWLQRVQMDLPSLWALSHFIFATCMAATFVTSTVSGATLIISVTGFCSAVGLWAPFTLLGEAILSHPISEDAGSIQLGDARLTHVTRPRMEEEAEELFRADVDEDEGSVEAAAVGYVRNEAMRGHAEAESPSLAQLEEEEGAVDVLVRGTDRGLSAQAGAILGIHNVFIVIPQFLVTGLASVIFAMVDGGAQPVVLHGHRSGDLVSARPNSIVIVFRLGGIAAAMAFVLSYRLAKQLARQ